MSNASRCTKLANHYASLAREAEDPAARRAYLRLEELWLRMAPLADSYDRSSDPRAKERIYAMIDEVEVVLRQVA